MSLYDSSFAPSIASLIAVGVELVTASLAAVAGARARRGSRQTDWWIVAGVFLVLAGWRLAGGELRLQDDMRAFAESAGIYGMRRESQAIVSVALIGAGFLAVWWIARGPYALSRLARWAALASVGYAALRFISLHAIDSLLYRAGPFHLNYVIDMGLTLACAALAGTEIRKQMQASPRDSSNR